MEISDKDLMRFMSKVKFFEKDKCWEWNERLRKDGYANFWIKDKVYLAHRISYIMARGMPPKNMSVCHFCDIRHCVNPDHLWLGTHDENMKDCVKKGRHVSAEALRTHCLRNHPFSEENTRVRFNKNGKKRRVCKACDALRARMRRIKK